MDMKTKMFRMTFYAFAALLVACTNVEGTYDAVYITEAQSAVEMTLSVDPDLIVEEPATVSLTISTSVKADADIQVGLKLSPELVDSYNSKNSTEYQFAPDGSFELSSFTATVAAGKSMSDAVVLTLKDGSKFESGVTYCIPVSIENTSSMTVLEPSRTVYVIIRTPVVSRAMYLTASNQYIVPGFEFASEYSAMSQVTMETMIYVKNFREDGNTISSVMGIEGEFGLRFGDVKIKPDQLQICHGNYQPAASTSLDKGRWYHVAAVYDGAKLSIYVDGAEAGGMAMSGETINLTSVSSRGFQMGGSYNDQNGRPLDGYIAETRVWSRALSAAELKNNMYYLNPEKATGLIAYWRMNDCEAVPAEDFTTYPTLSGSGFRTRAQNVVRDVSGNGYDAYGEKSPESVEYLDTKWL